MSITITVYDGANCIGGNKILLEADGTRVFLDFGVNFGARGRFFAEYLKPRSTRGLLDLISTGLLPPLLGIYRSDLIVDDLASAHRGRIPARELHLNGVLLSHAHLDHTGCISFLDPEIPVFCSLTTAVVCKAMQDSASGDLEREVVYATPREIKHGLLSAANYRTTPYRQRPFVITGTEGLTPELGAFWATPGTSRKMSGVSLRTASAPGTRDFRVGNLDVSVFSVDHSVPGSSAFAVQTSEGWVIYTGDLRLHGAAGNSTTEFIERAASLKPLMLICEGTHPEAKQPVTEEEVYHHALGAVMSTAGLAVADFGPRNVERLMTFRAIAGATGRQLALTAQDAYLLEAMSLADPAIPNPMQDDSFVMYVEAKSSRPVWEEVLMERWPDDRLRSAQQIGARPGEFILCFSFYDLGEFIDIAPDSGVYVYSASEAFHEEASVDLERVRHWARYWNLRFVGDTGDQKGKGREPGFHASGHIHGPGLAAMIKDISPRFLIPVHTQNPAFFRRTARLGMTVIVPEPGQPISISGKAVRTGA